MRRPQDPRGAPSSGRARRGCSRRGLRTRGCPQRPPAARSPVGSGGRMGWGSREATRAEDGRGPAGPDRGRRRRPVRCVRPLVPAARLGRTTRGPRTARSGAQVEHGALRAGRSARARGWGARGQQCGERVSLLAPAEPGPPRRLTLPPASFPSPAGGGGGFRCAGVSSRPDTSLFQSFPGGTHWPGKTVWQPSARRSGARLGGQSAPSRSDRRPPHPPQSTLCSSSDRIC